MTTNYVPGLKEFMAEWDTGIQESEPCAIRVELGDAGHVNNEGTAACFESQIVTASHPPFRVRPSWSTKEAYAASRAPK